SCVQFSAILVNFLSSAKVAALAAKRAYALIIPRIPHKIKGIYHFFWEITKKLQLAVVCTLFRIPIFEKISQSPCKR
ncbi:MAG: hypothetical protein ACI3XM_06020, partial [Eubacteriales bacterium]